jgi:hypothetical protein
MVKVLKLDQRDVSDILEEVNLTYLPEDSDTTITNTINTLTTTDVKDETKTSNVSE